MKPRFSILTLLGITAYAAVTVAGLIRPETVWFRISELAWLAVMLLWVAIAVQASSRRSAIPARAAIGSALLYLLFCNNAVLSSPPHEWLSNWVAMKVEDKPEAVQEVVGSNVADSPRADDGQVRIEYAPPGDIVWLGPTAQQLSAARSLDRFNAVAELVALQSSLAFGLLGGALALWRYRVLERRAKDQPT